MVNEILGNGQDAPSVLSDAFFFLFHRRCLQAGMYVKEKQHYRSLTA